MALFNEMMQSEGELRIERDRLRALLRDFRDFTVENATVWKTGAQHHHPIWRRVADAIEP